MNPGWATVIAAAIGASALVLGAALRDRWPSELRDANRLTAIIEKMKEDTGERQLAEEYRDDLVVSWVLARVSPHDSLWRALGMYAASLSMLFLLGTAFMFGLVGWFIATRTTVLPLLAPLVFMVLAAGLSFAVTGWAARKWSANLDAYMRSVRSERGMRKPVSRWFTEHDKARAQGTASQSKNPPRVRADDGAAAATPKTPDNK